MISLVVRHPSAPQSWSNAWEKGIGPKMEAITTDADVAGQCQKGTRVRFHRCAFSSFPAVICCEATVKAVQPLGKDYLVTFDGQVALDLEPSYQPQQGQNWY